MMKHKNQKLADVRKALSSHTIAASKAMRLQGGDRPALEYPWQPSLFAV